MMPRIPNLALLCLWLLAGFWPSVALGQTVPSPYQFIENRHEAGIVVGHGSPGTGRFGYGPAPGASLGLRYGIRLGGPFALDAVLAHLPTTRDIIDPSRAEGDRVVGTSDAWIATLDARLRFNLTGDRTWRGLSPFAFAGLGGAFDLKGVTAQERELLELETDRFHFRPTFLGALGSGIAWYPSERLMFRADASMVMWRLRTPLGFRSPEREFVGVGENEWVSGPSFTLGAAFRF